MRLGDSTVPNDVRGCFYAPSVDKGTGLKEVLC